MRPRPVLASRHPVDLSSMKTIAIVEDEPAIRSNYAAAFERNGYAVRA